MSEIKVNEKQTDTIILEKIRLHLENVNVEEERFLDLLKHSLSLDTIEKKRVIDAVPTLSQFQFDELEKVFSDEREKFRDLASKHPDDIKKLVAKQQKEWLELWDLYFLDSEKEKVKWEDDKKIEDIKKNLGL